MKDITLIWFRRDLRLSDNIALSTASRDDNVAAIYIYDPAIILKKDFSYLHFDFIAKYYLLRDMYFHTYMMSSLQLGV
ncbi:deoxyribodipyrimidine photo-lyase [Candidatus Marinimicrobia bacterium]|nr:deoxyribodipyrimidine photo-lyase [Candidatus Neomarinimicrobiota bacterium]